MGLTTTIEEVEDNVWKDQMICSLAKLLKDDEFTDITIKTANQCFRAHKMILSMGSPYFKTLLASGWKESQSEVIDLNDCETDCFRDILDYIYSGKVILTLENVTGVLMQADYFQILQLKSLCCRYLKNHLNEQNSLPIYELAERHHCIDLKKYSFRFAMKNLSEVVLQNNFLDLLPETIIDVLQSIVVSIESEDELFIAIKMWLAVDEERAVLWRQKMLDLIWIDSLTKENQIYYQSEVDKIKEEANGEYSIKNVPCRYKREVELILGFGGESCGRIMQNGESMAVCGSNHSKWSCAVMAELPNTDDYNIRNGYFDVKKRARILTTPTVPRTYGTIVIKDNVLYLIGGLSECRYLSSVEAYYLDRNEFEQLPSLPSNLHGCGSVVFDDQIWVVGGKNLEADGTSIYCFDEEEQRWLMKPSLKKGRCHLGVATMDNFIYAVGGLIIDQLAKSSHLATDFCEKFDPLENCWKPIARLQISRAYHCTQIIGGYLYAIGGYDGSLTWLSSMERYDPILDQWFICPSMMTARSSFGATVCNGNIYCMGGFSGTTVLNSVERFNPRNNKWHCVDSMKLRRMGLVAGTLIVPRDRFESETMAQQRKDLESKRKDAPQDSSLYVVKQPLDDQEATHSSTAKTDLFHLELEESPDEAGSIGSLLR